jgi:ribosomal protein S18 acetylase RimI-like enzyme
MLAENMVDQLYIDIPFRGKKLGKQLIQIAKDMYPEKLALFTLKENKNAIAFYERQGFKIIRYGIAPDEGIPDVYMEWSAE